MQYNNMYQEPETLENTKDWIENNLKRGSKAINIARAMIGKQKAKLIITKEFDKYIDELKNDEILKLLVEYINDVFKDHMKRSCVSDVIKDIMEKNFYGIDIDEYGDYLTILLNEGAYQRVEHHIINIMVSYEPYMKEKYPDDFENMTQNEHEVALIEFIKEHLCSCANKKPVNSNKNCN